MHTIRPAAVAGSFYPANPASLAAEINALLREAGEQLPDDAPSPKAIIAPHAGYIYSGPVAASVYARLARVADRISRVVLLGPAHRVAVRGLALPGTAAFQTPLGEIPIDQQGADALSTLPQVTVSTEAHAFEHSLEVHLPFLQSLLGRFTLLPLVVGQATAEDVAQVLERVWGGDETLIVVSSDLSHYLTYQQAQTADRNTVQAILNRRGGLTGYQACGAIPVNGLLLAADRHRLFPQLHDSRNSGDTAGDRSRVVGYASLGFYPVDPGASDNPGDILIPIARSAIGDTLGMAIDAREDHPMLHEHAACFVTLTRHGVLRGCIGSLQAHRRLLDDVRANAKAAAFLDPRFEPLTPTEFQSTLIEISLLSAAEDIAFDSEEAAQAGLRPGIDGLILEYGPHRSTFLPQVWEQLPDPRDFFSQLKRKAGLSPDFWAEDLKLKRYTVTKWREHDLPGIVQST